MHTRTVTDTRNQHGCSPGVPRDVVAVTGTDRAIRYSTIGAVSVVALVAAFVSYRHALTVVRAHGESGGLALAYPRTIDGMIYASSMVLLNAARRGAERPWLAYFALGLGIAATLAANVAAGLAYGAVGALVAAWPAPALVISYELLTVVIRSSVSTAPAEQSQPALTQVAQDAEQAAQNALRATAAAGNPLSGRQLADRFGLNRAQVVQVRSAVLAESNGHEEVTAGDG
jgi:hypothetical protein